ncbi:MAG: hypothetical protein K5681_03290 [Treponema sp.]|nr:hypothetical protein [Treponema sp.]
MKKLVLLFALASIFTFTMFAQEESESQSGSNISIERHEEKWTSLSYVNVPVLKILEDRDAYVIVYQKNKIGTGTTVIPKNWAHGNKENPAKLKLRTTKLVNGTFMTIVKDNGEFLKVILTAPLAKNNSIWGVVARGKEIEGKDKDTLEEIEL